MDVRSKQPIKEHLQKKDVQERILQYIQKGRDEATVTISRAADLFGITENKLRDWEEYGFLNPLRPGGPKGRRLYTPSELDKLAIIRELINAGYAASDIPPDIDKVWHAIHIPRDNALTIERSDGSFAQAEQPINLRRNQARQELFWRYYVSHVLRFSLMLISEDIPNTAVGLILPLNPAVDTSTIRSIEDISRVGESLVGWLSQSRSSQTLLTPRPSFQYSSDFRFERLRTMKAGLPQTDVVQNNTLIVLQREARPLTLSAPLIETVHRLLQPLYEDVEASRQCFGRGMRDQLDPATDLNHTSNYEDIILNGLTEMVIRLGGRAEDGQSRWRFCCLFLPNHPTAILSQQQRSLLVRAQSEQAPYVVGTTTQTPQEPFISSSIRAFQSGHVVSLPSIPVKESEQAQQSPEGLVRSSLAVPIEGDDGTAVAVLYVASHRPMAFTESDQRVLRMVGRMIRELLETYRIRLLAADKLRTIIANPSVVDTQFQEFLSEGEFISHVESLLADIQYRNTFQPTEIISFIAIDIDNQSSIANKYGDSMARDLCRAVGLRIYSQLRAFKDESEYKVYHICADRFYILLRGMTLEQARVKAGQLRQTLEGTYQIDPHRTPIGQAALAEHMVTLSNITVRLGVSSYPYQKLEEVLHRYPSHTATIEVRMQITGFLEEALALGKQKGGNIVMSWDPIAPGFVRLPL